VEQDGDLSEEPGDAYVKKYESMPFMISPNLLAHFHQFGDNGVDEGDVFLGVSESDSARKQAPERTCGFLSGRLDGSHVG
jgi:hypothetical protein